MGNGERNMLPRPFSSVTLWERPKPRASAPSPAKAGGEAARLRTIGSRANERTPAVLAGRTGWGGVPFGSVRAVSTPSQPPPAFAGGGAKAKLAAEAAQIGRAHVRTPVTNAHLVCRPLLEKKKTHRDVYE